MMQQLQKKKKLKLNVKNTHTQKKQCKQKFGRL